MSVTIQFCHNCKSHQWSTRHNESRYRQLFSQFDQRFRQIGFKVIAIKNPRLGSFEVSLGQYTLFSKLETGQFPLVEEVVNMVNEFSKVEDKRERYREMKKRNNGKQVERMEFSQRNWRVGKRPLSSSRGTHSFSSLKHRNEYKSYSQSKRMAFVLKSSRDEASLTATKTVFQLQQQFANTARSRFFNSEKEVNPERYERMARSEMMSRDDRDKIIAMEEVKERNRRMREEGEKESARR